MYSCERLNINMVGPPLGPSNRNRNATVTARKTTSFFALLHASATRQIRRAI